MPDLPNTRAAVQALARERVAERALALQNHIKENLSHPGSGRTYKRQNREHQASAPGESPAVDLNDLRSSILTQKLNPEWYRVGVSAGKGDGSLRARAPALEFGSRTIKPRPFIRPALEQLKAELTS